MFSISLSISMGGSGAEYVEDNLLLEDGVFYILLEDGFYLELE